MREVQEELILKTLEATVAYTRAEERKLADMIMKEERVRRTKEGEDASDSSDSAAKGILKAGELATSSDKREGDAMVDNDKKIMEEQEKEERDQRMQEMLRTEKKETDKIASELAKVEADK
eukprot:7481984-Heterocapsa_arctica.AAC.1